MALPKNPNIVFDTNQLHEYFDKRFSVSTLNIWRMKGRGPKYLKVGSKVLYQQKDADEWLLSHVIDPEQRGA